MNINTYTNAAAFLAKAQPLLESKELENNMMLGICLGLASKEEASDPNPSHHFLTNSDEKGEIVAASICTFEKALLAAKDSQYIAGIADYYKKEVLGLKGVFAEKSLAKAFATYYQAPQIIDSVEMQSHLLTSLQEIQFPKGEALLAEDADVDLIADWCLAFEYELGIYPMRTKSEFQKFVQNAINHRNFYKWVAADGTIVSMAALMRQTPHIGIVGLVYTPLEWRGKGYGKATVWKLTEYILEKKGSKFAGLFTDVSNPISNAIYQKIGYQAENFFLDLSFGIDSHFI